MSLLMTVNQPERHDGKMLFKCAIHLNIA